VTQSDDYQSDDPIENTLGHEKRPNNLSPQQQQRLDTCAQNARSIHQTMVTDLRRGFAKKTLEKFEATFRSLYQVLYELSGVGRDIDKAIGHMDDAIRFIGVAIEKYDSINPRLDYINKCFKSLGKALGYIDPLVKKVK